MIDCVIGAAVGYTGEQIRPFLKSLRSTGYIGGIILFANGGAATEAAKWGVDVRPCPKVKTLPHAERFYWICDALSQLDCEGVLCVDTRDIIFQINPASLPDEGLHTFEEDNSMTIGSCPYNSEWVKIGYGAGVLAKMKNFPISCVGSICGDLLSVTLHLQALVAELHRLQPLTRKPQDQSCHNFLIRNSWDEQFNGFIHSNEDAEIYTVGYIPRETVVIKDDKILNKSGLVPTVIHQWERHNNLMVMVDEIYG